ncbi:3-oxo-5-alpha-steroid 4-dehydrogenase family protein [Striga hermonthica]|uniref:3-oxo-5-alpha-steroid 4-dehydrogenase family protein n=1 Tax=Striga hermonthica TaxID=68872 RepID=A0A9N7R035_STRHE|nr:3-oxo-5-alpha-steroid 4-dehydrogenase family protein [Striga hermonthica]
MDVPWTSVFQWILYPPPPSAWVNALSVISFLSMGNGGWMEIKGKHMQYSKFTTNHNNSNKYVEKQKEMMKAKVPSKVGMVVVYGPALVAGISTFALFPFQDFRFTALRSAVTLHFFKRILEVLLVHKYSGWMDVDAMIPISLSYFTYAITIIYSQHLIQMGASQPAVDLKYIGISIYFLGITANFYHHYLLSTLRTTGKEKRYEMPRGGLFSFVVCPHYLFEIVGFIGICCISQSVFAVSHAMGTVLYLMGRSYATRKWYEYTFENFPKDVKALFPYVF